jgi:hypothetical protein
MVTSSNITQCGFYFIDSEYSVLNCNDSSDFAELAGSTAACFGVCGSQRQQRRYFN